LNFGLYLPNFGSFGNARAIADLARDAEASGWDGLFVWDHVARPGAPDVVDPWVALAAAAACTTRLRLGTTVTPLPRRRPWKLARESVSLDRLSGGRLILGVGIGSGRDVEWDAFGEERDARVRGAMLDEGLAVLTGLWSGEPFSFEGAHYRVERAQFRPTPAQTPRIPIWVGGTWPARIPLERAARWDGYFPLFGPHGAPGDVALLAQAAARVRERRERAGATGPFDVVKHSGPGTPLARDARAELAARYGRAGATWWLDTLVPEAFDGVNEPGEAMRERVLEGPPS
jgi:alkanesulfonate monooxygenase SsuD/methylene tetrahydromethanopterin reductase-like flavin-dependent oxidoreductase (luciferase family)